MNADILAPTGPNWDLTLRRVDLTSGFALLFLFFPSHFHARAAQKVMAAHLQQKGHTLAELPESDSQSVRELILQMLDFKPTGPIGSLWIPVYREALAPDFAQWSAALRQALSACNQQRNVLQRHFSFPLIFVGTHELLAILQESAPDLWSARQGSYEIVPEQTIERFGLEDSDQSQEIYPRSDEAAEPELAETAAAELGARFEAALRDQTLAEYRAGLWSEWLYYLLLAARGFLARYDPANAQRVVAEAARALAHPDAQPTTQRDAATLTRLGSIYSVLGRFAEAEATCRQALVLSESILGPVHPYIGRHLNTLGAVLLRDRRFAEAEQLFRRAVAIGEMYGDTDQLAVAFGNLASTFEIAGRLPESEEYFQKALGALERGGHANLSRLAVLLNNFGNLLVRLGDYEKAENVLNRALTITKANRGLDHPDVASRLTSLARLYGATGRLDEAERCLGRALFVREKALGPKHWQIAQAMNALAALMARSGDFSGAAKWCQKAVAMAEDTLGPESPEAVGYKRVLRQIEGLVIPSLSPVSR